MVGHFPVAPKQPIPNVLESLTTVRSGLAHAAIDLAKCLILLYISIRDESCFGFV